MASGTLVDGGGDVPRKNRWIENKVYTRRIFKKKGSHPPPPPLPPPPSSQTVASEDGNISSLQQQSSTRLDAKDLASEDSTSLQKQQEVVVDGDKPKPERDPPTNSDQKNPTESTVNFSVQIFENHVSISLSSMSKQQKWEVKQKLVDELQQVRNALKQVEARALEIQEQNRTLNAVDNCEVDGGGDDCAVDDCAVDDGGGDDCAVDDGGGDCALVDAVDGGGDDCPLGEALAGVGDGADCDMHVGGGVGVGVGVGVGGGGGGGGGGGEVEGEGEGDSHPNSAANNLENYDDGRGMNSEVNLDVIDGGRMSAGAHLDNGSAHLDNGSARRLISNVSLDSGGARRMIPEVGSDNRDGRRMMSDDIDVVDTGAGRGMVPEFNLEEDYDGRRMFTEANFDYGIPRRVVPASGLNYGIARTMISDDYLDNHSSMRRLVPEVNSGGKRDPPRSLHQLRVSVMENGHGRLGDYVEKEKRTPKANQYYRNSDFIVGKEKLPPPNKKSKINGSKKHGRGGERDYVFGLIKHTSQVFKNCNSLLTKLMKHKHGWVFNEPVDVEKLCLHDYFFIIKHPMDLGTVKTRLSTNWYRSPREFAEDVRLTFSNAMTYNPKGQDVHIMAEQLSHIFEDRWAVMEAEFNLDSWIELYHEVGYSTPVTKQAPFMPPEMGRNLERAHLMPQPVKSKPVYHGSSRRGTALKKPKAKDVNKRNMTYEEKQKLSTNLQNMPPEKQENIVEIIKRRSSSLVQNDDQIEVDIDSVDNETLWELDRFVTNFKKSLSKYKRKAELALQARKEAERKAQEKNQIQGTLGASKETKIDEKNMGLPRPRQEDKQQDNSSRSSSSSSSSSDSGSSSSDSDTDSSSESEAEHSPRS